MNHQVCLTCKFWLGGISQNSLEWSRKMQISMSFERVEFLVCFGSFCFVCASLYFFALLGFERRASQLLGSHSTTWVTLPATFFFFKDTHHRKNTVNNWYNSGSVGIWDLLTFSMLHNLCWMNRLIILAILLWILHNEKSLRQELDHQQCPWEMQGQEMTMREKEEW
jgi:hypothetical protein